MLPKSPLQRAIDQCYDAFASNPRPLALHASPLGDPVALLRTLTAKPLRELSGDEIGPYAGWALTTVGDEADYRHFLPRILEQAVRESAWTGTDPPIIAERLKIGQWLTWPSPEQHAVRALFLEAWQQALGEHPDEVSAEDWLCGIAVLELDVQAALGVWRERPTINSALQLAACVKSLAFEQQVDNRGYWGYAKERDLILIKDWLKDEAARRLPACRDRVSTSDSWLIDSALQRLDELRSDRRH